MINIQPGMIYVTPSRESISYDPFTINNLKIILTRVYNKINFNQRKIDRISKRFSNNWEPKVVNTHHDTENLIFIRDFNDFKSIRERKFLKRIAKYNPYVVDKYKMKTLTSNIRGTRIHPFMVILSNTKGVGNFDRLFKSSLKVGNVAMIKCGIKEKPKIIEDLKRYGIGFIENIASKNAKRETNFTIRCKYNREYDYDMINIEKNGDFYIIPNSISKTSIYYDKAVYYITDRNYKSKKWADIVERHKFDQQAIINKKIKELNSPEFSSLKYIRSLLDYSGRSGYYSILWARDIVLMAAHNQDISLKIFGEVIPSLDKDKFNKMLNGYDLFLRCNNEDFSVQLIQSKTIKDFLGNLNEFTNTENVIKILNLMEKS